MDYDFRFDADKNIKLKQERGISFEEAIFLINSGKLIKVLEHPNKEKYPNQKIYVIDVDGYAYLMPFVRTGSEVFLKTIFPSRKKTKELIKRGKQHECEAN